VTLDVGIDMTAAPDTWAEAIAATNVAIRIKQGASPSSSASPVFTAAVLVGFDRQGT